MATLLRFQPFPKMWDIDSASGPQVRVGKTTLAVSDISNVTSEDVAESDHWGVMLMGVLFLSGAMAILIGVNHYGWRTRFLLGAGILFFFGLVSLYEAARTRMVHYVRLRLVTKSGDVLFTSADPADAQALLIALQSR
jgi:hypothetical protein